MFWSWNPSIWWIRYEQTQLESLSILLGIGIHLHSLSQNQVIPDFPPTRSENDVRIWRPSMFDSDCVCAYDFDFFSTTVMAFESGIVWSRFTLRQIRSWYGEKDKNRSGSIWQSIVTFLRLVLDLSSDLFIPDSPDMKTLGGISSLQTVSYLEGTSVAIFAIFIPWLDNWQWHYDSEANFCRHAMFFGLSWWKSSKWSFPFNMKDKDFSTSTLIGDDFDFWNTYLTCVEFTNNFLMVLLSTTTVKTHFFHEPNEGSVN